MFTIASEIHIDRVIAGAEIERLLKLVRQIGKRHFFVYAEVFHERALQLAVISLHSFRPAPPRCDRPFRQRFLRIGNHQLDIADKLCPKTMTCRTRAEVAVKRKVSRR